MALNIKGIKSTLFEQSKNVDDGISSRKKKYFELTIPGCKCLPAYNSAAVPAQFHRFYGRYTIIEEHEIIAIIELPAWATLISIQISGVPGNDWIIFENGTEIATGSGTTEKKLNIMIKEGKTYTWYQEYMVAGNYVENIKIKYVV